MMLDYLVFIGKLCEIAGVWLGLSLVAMVLWVTLAALEPAAKAGE